MWTRKFILQIQALAFMLMILIFVVLVLYSFKNIDKPDARMVVGMFLPALSTWIGIMIGFYFSRGISSAIEKDFKTVVKDSTRDRREEIRDIIKKIEKINRLSDELK